MDKSEIKSKYEELYPHYKRLGENLKNALLQFLEDSKIDYLDVEYRIKSFESFYEKIERKNYKNPFEEIQDICGLRIINYYPSDLEKITDIIKKEFNVIESVDKQDELDDDKFGYRSYHYIAKLDKEWTKAPNYRNLDELIFEIQARTILMHGWAVINHKLLYKHEKDIPKQFRRDLFRLSALIELADEQFEILREERKKYVDETIKEMDNGVLNEFDSLNVDTLQALLISYFPNRKGIEDISEILEKINKTGLNLYEFNENIKKSLPYLEKIEKEEFELDLNGYSGLSEWNYHALVITILDLTVDKHLELMHHPYSVTKITEKYREELNSKAES